MSIVRTPFSFKRSLWKPDANTKLWLPGQDDPQSATIRDRSGNGNDGTITGATWVRLSSGLWGLSFDGTDDLVAANGVATGGFFGGAHTILGWASLTAWAANRTIAGGGIYATHYYSQIDFTTADKKFYARTGGLGGANNVASSGTYDNDSAYHLFASCVDTDGKIVRFVINSTDQGADATNATDLSAIDKFFLGQLPYDAGDGINPWKGTVALTRVFNKVLTLAEITAIYNQERSLFGV